MSKRCPWAIRYGVVLVTRCFLDAGHDERTGHRGRGLKDSPSIIAWFAGDRREFESTHTDHWSWEESRAKR